MAWECENGAIVGRRILEEIRDEMRLSCEQHADVREERRLSREQHAEFQQEHADLREFTRETSRDFHARGSA
jgi:hypothetical protein